AHFGKLGLIATAASLSPLLAPTDALAYCIGSDRAQPHFDPAYYTIGHEMGRSRFVVRARVIHEVWIGEDGKEKALTPPFQDGASRPWGFDPYLGAFYDLQVKTAY